MPLNWKNLGVRLASAGRVLCEPGWHLAAERAFQFDDYDLWFIYAGRGTMELSDRTIDLVPGVCIWMRPRGHYVARQDPQQRLGVSFTHFELIDLKTSKSIPREVDLDPNRHGKLPPEAFELPDLGCANAITRRSVELIRLARHGGRAASFMQSASEMLRGLLIDLDVAINIRKGGLTFAPAHYRKREAFVLAATRLSENPAEMPTVESLASGYGYCADHFSRLFRQHTGQTPRDFAIQARIDRARRLLIDSDYPISEIAEMLGYRNIYHFSSQFKQKAGMSPSAFRQQSKVSS